MALSLVLRRMKAVSTCHSCCIAVHVTKYSTHSIPRCTCPSSGGDRGRIFADNGVAPSEAISLMSILITSTSSENDEASQSFSLPDSDICMSMRVPFGNASQAE